VALQVVDPAEALSAVDAGCRIVMVDTGTIDVLASVDTALRRAQAREGITLAYGGGVTGHTLGPARAAGADVVAIGRAIIDAPLWDLRVEVEA
jgi:nicotinate-nucleotide pyrophosphorylase (carboxylating)